MRILIVEDSNFMRLTMEKMFRTYLPEAELDLAADGEEALEKYKSFSPDFMIMDLLIPKIKGQDVIRQVRTENPKVGVIVVSADVQIKVREELESYGIMKFISKPIHDSKMLEIAELIRGGNNHAE